MSIEIDTPTSDLESHDPSPLYANGVVPQEGENGLYSQTWFPIARSEDVPVGTVIGTEFLGGRVAVFRGEDGVAAVVSSYCAHMGADIAGGDVLGNTVRCPFHFWRYERNGLCERTGSGDAVPPGAKVFSFPTQERFGLIFAFNGEEPLFELPGFSLPDREVEIVSITEYEIQGDGWEYMCNTFDFNHFIWVHGLEFDPPAVDGITWDEWSGTYPMQARDADGYTFDAVNTIIATNFYRMESMSEGRLGLTLYACKATKPGQHVGYQIIATTKGDGSEAEDAEIEAWGREATAWGDRIVLEDAPILNTMRFRPLRLTKADAHLRRYLRLLRDFPRAHPSRDYI